MDQTNSTNNPARTVLVLCDPDGNDCGAGTCTALSGVPGIYRCQ